MNRDTNDDGLVIVDDEALALDPGGERAKPAPRSKEELAPDVVESLRQQLDSLKAERDAERLGRTQAEQLRVDAEQEARRASEAEKNAKRTAEVSHYHLVESHIGQAKARTNELKREIRLANESGDYERASELQVDMAKVAARLLQYEDAKDDIESRERVRQSRPEREEAPAPRAPERPADPFEAQIAHLTGPTRDWLRAHKECVTDEVRSKEAVAADAKARREGLRPDTPEYFTYIEENLGYRQRAAQAEPEGDETEDEVIVSDPKPVVRKPAATHAAPVSRDAIANGRPVAQIRLSRAEVEMAEQLGMSPKEYHQWKVKADKDGRYTN